MKKLFSSILLTSCTMMYADQMAIWDFGPNAAGYTETVTTHQLTVAPTLVVSGALKDGNGKDGNAYTDAAGAGHAAGQSGAWDDTENGSTAAEVTITLNTTGWSDLNFGFDYWSESGEVRDLDIAYRVGTTGPWTTVLDNSAITADSAWHRFNVDLSAIASIENAGTVQLLITDLDDDGNTTDVDEFRIDNVEITGTRVGCPTIALVPTRVTDGPYVSGVINDATDPVGMIGVSFTVGHPVIPPGNLTVTASSTAPGIVPNDAAHLVLTHVGANVTLRILAADRGYSTIHVNVSDGNCTVPYDLHYAATFNGTPDPNAYVYGVGFSDASAAIAIDNDYMLVANDELAFNNCCPLNTPGPHIFLMDRQASGRPYAAYDFTANLNLTDPDRELDLEGATRIGNRAFWLGALSNNKDGKCRPNRDRIFATDITGVALNTQLNFWGYYAFLREDLINWDSGNWHGLGANHYGFQAGAFCASSGGNPPKIINGFNVEGIAIGPDGTTAYIGFRAPLVPAVPGGRALIVPIKNFGAWFAQVDGTRQVSRRLTAADFDKPIELNLNGRSIRSIEGNSAGEYLIAAGSYADAEDTGISFQLYRWSGNPKDTNPKLFLDLPNPVPQPLFAGEPIQPGGYEGIPATPFPLNGSLVDLVLDNGRSKWYSDADDEAKTLPGGHQRFATESMIAPAPGTIVANGGGGGAAGVCVTDDGTVYSIQDNGQLGVVYALRATDLSTKWTYNLDSTAPYGTFGPSPAVAVDGTVYAGNKDYLHAINPDGTTKWSFNLSGRRVRSNVALGADGTVYLCAEDTSAVYAYAIWPNGTQRWVYNMGWGTAEGIALSQNALIVANEDGGGVYAIDSQSGGLLWQVHPVSSAEPENVTVASDGTIYVTGEDNNMTALDSNGNVKWVYATPNSVDGDVVIGSGGMIYLTDNNGGVHAVRPNGTAAWYRANVHTSCSSGLTLGPDGTLYLVNCEGVLMGLSSVDGSTKWSTTLSGQVYTTSRPGLSQNGILYINTTAGTVAVYANSGWSLAAYQSAMAPYARSGWPTPRQNPFGTAQAVAGQPFLLEAAWQVSKSLTASNSQNLALNEAQGYHFTPLVNGEICGLGGCFSGVKTVKLFNRSTHALLAQAQVSSTNNWSYASIASVPVYATNSYTVAAYLQGSGSCAVTDTNFPRNSTFIRIDGATRIDTSTNSEAVPTNIITTGQICGQADIQFRPSGGAVWGPISTLQSTNVAWSYVMGYHFTPQKDGWITDVGGLFNGNKVMKVFEFQSGKVLYSNTVSSANSYAYAAMDPLPVKQGTNYTVAVYLAGSGGSYSLSQSNLFPRTNNYVRITGSTYLSVATNDFSSRPTNSFGTIMYGQADVRFVPKN